MIYELIHTSWPKGLRSGISGYTPVAYTEGMPARYITLCESLSGYTHLYPLGHPHYHQNPVAYSHFQFHVDGRPLSVLSKVASAGIDYSGRENKLAHHIVVEHDGKATDHSILSQALRCGPAWAMLHGNLFCDQWKDAPHLLPEGRVHFPSLSILDEKFEARTWKRVMGDAGWAGLLAQSALEWPHRPSFILFDPMDGSENESICLQLIVEAMTLLPPERRWKVTFNTYFVTKPMDSNCLWRCCVKGAQDLPSLKRYPGALVFDLVEKSDRDEEISPGEEELIRCAQRGTLPPWATDVFTRLESTPLEKAHGIIKSTPILTPPNPLNFDTHSEINFEGTKIDESAYVDDGEVKKSNQKSPMILVLGVMIAGLIVMVFWGGQLLRIWDPRQVGSPENKGHINFEDVKQPEDESKQPDRVLKNDIILLKPLPKAVPETIFAIPLSSIVLQFYHSANRLKGISSTTDFSGLHCRLMTPYQEEMAVAIEKPVTLDTQNWEMTIAEVIHGGIQTKNGTAQTTSRLGELTQKGKEDEDTHLNRNLSGNKKKGNKKGDRVGYLSLRKISLYHPTEVSAVFFQADQNGISNYIWTSPMRIDPSQLIPQKPLSEKERNLDNKNRGILGKANGGHVGSADAAKHENLDRTSQSSADNSLQINTENETETWQLMVGSEYPDLLRLFLSIIEKNEMRGVVDLIASHGVEKVSHTDSIAVNLEKISGGGKDQRSAFIIAFTLPHGENGEIHAQWENSIRRRSQGHENIVSDEAEVENNGATESQISSKKVAIEAAATEEEKPMILKKITILHKTDQGEEIPIFVIQ